MFGPSPAFTALTKGTENVDDLLSQEELSSALDELYCQSASVVEDAQKTVQTYLPKLLNVALREIADETAKESPQLATTYPRNASLLLAWFCNTSKGINEVIPIAFGTLARKGIIHPAISQNISSIVSAAFSDPTRENFASERVKLALTDEVMHGSIRQLSHSTLIGDMLLNVFAPQLNKMTVSTAISLSRNAFASHWVSLGFPQHLVAYATIAMSDEDCNSYFYFMTELLGKAVTAEAGPLVDELMSEEVCGSLFRAVAEAVEAGEEQFPLAAEGVRLLYVYLSVLEMFFVTEDAKPGSPTGAKPKAVLHTQWPVPVTTIFEVLPRLIAQVKPVEGDAVVGELRYRVARLLHVLVGMKIEGLLEKVAQEGGLLEMVFNLCEHYPNSDLLLAIVDTFYQQLPELIEEREAKCVVQPSLRVAKWQASMANDGLYKSTALAAHMPYFVNQLVCASKQEKLGPLFDSELVAMAESAFASVDYESKITGDDFLEKKEDPELGPIVHRDMSNPRDVSLDVTSPTTPSATEDAAINSLLDKAMDMIHEHRARYASFNEDFGGEGEAGADGDVSGLVLQDDAGDWFTGDDDEEGKGDGATAGSVGSSHIEGQDDDDDVDDDSAWETANQNFEKQLQQSSSEASPSEVSTDQQGQEAAPLASPPAPASSELRPISADSADAGNEFYSSGQIADEDEDGVVYMTPPSTPPEPHDGAADVWRPGSRGDGDGALPISAGSFGNDDVIPHPPNGVEAEDDGSDDDGEDEANEDSGLKAKEVSPVSVSADPEEDTVAIGE